MKKATYIFCLVGWCICLGLSVASAIRGELVSPMTAIFPTLICILHYVTKLLEQAKET